MCVLYMCALYTCMYLCECTASVCARVENRDVRCSPLSSSVLLHWGRVSPSTYFHWAGGQQAARIHLSPPLSAGATGALSHALFFLHGSWGPKLRSSCVKSKCSYPVSHLSSPGYLFVNATFDESGICENLRARCTKRDGGAFQGDILGKSSLSPTREREMYCGHCENTWYGNWHCEPSQSWFRWSWCYHVNATQPSRLHCPGLINPAGESYGQGRRVRGGRAEELWIWERKYYSHRGCH